MFSLGELFSIEVAALQDFPAGADGKSVAAAADRDKEASDKTVVKDIQAQKQEVRDKKAQGDTAVQKQEAKDLGLAHAKCLFLVCECDFLFFIFFICPCVFVSVFLFFCCVLYCSVLQDVVKKIIPCSL